MKRIAPTIGLAAAVCVLSGCATRGFESPYYHPPGAANEAKRQSRCDEIIGDVIDQTLHNLPNLIEAAF